MMGSRVTGESKLWADWKNYGHVCVGWNTRKAIFEVSKEYSIPVQKIMEAIVIYRLVERKAKAK